MQLISTIPASSNMDFICRKDLIKRFERWESMMDDWVKAEDAAKRLPKEPEVVILEEPSKYSESKDAQTMTEENPMEAPLAIEDAKAVMAEGNKVLNVLCN